MRVALVHDWLTNLGGGERVLAALADVFIDAPIYTSVYNPGKLSLFKDRDVRTSFLQNWPLAQRKHQLYPILRTLAFESFNFSQYDIVISSSSAEAKGIITTTETMHISYIHPPTRYYWSGYDDYLRSPGMGALNPLAKDVMPHYAKKMRHWDYAAAQRPDMLVANSQTVADRISRYYNRSSKVIFPPVDVDRFKVSKEKGKYYLVVSRLIPYKRVDLAVQACNKLKLPLKIVGVGPEMKRLQSIAGPTIEFLGSLSDEQTASQYTNCKAFIFTANEDFGITPVEAMAAGKPVIAYNKGGATETVKDSITGVFFEKQSKESLIKAIKASEQINYSSAQIIARAELFSKKRFIKNILDLVETSIEKKVQDDS